MLISVKRSNFTLAFFKATCQANLGLRENEQDQAHIFQDIYIKSFQAYQLTIMYYFKSTNQDIHLNFLFLF